MVKIALFHAKRRFFYYFPVMLQAVFTSRRLESPQQTAREMLRIAQQYAGDLGEMARWPVKRFFDHVRKLPYRPDPPKAETLSRPLHTLKVDFPFRDCDDKAILMGAWCHANRVPFGFYASSTRKDSRLHHVWTVAEFPAGPVVLDPTYHYHKIGILPQREKLTKVVFLQGSPMYLNTFEGRETLGFSISKGLKKVGRSVKKTAVAPVKAVKASATQIKRGNIIQAAKAAVKPIPYASRTISATQKAAGQVKRGNVLSAGKTLARAATAPVKDAAGVIGRNMPAAIKAKVKAAVRKVAGDKVTSATKAVILPTVTAAALAIPGVQPFAAGVGVVVNLALDEIIAEAKKKAGKTVQAVKRTATAAKTSPAVKAAAAKPVNARAMAAAAALKKKMEEAKQNAAENAQPAQVAPVDEVAAPAGMSTKKKILIGGGIAAASGLYIATRKKGRS